MWFNLVVKRENDQIELRFNGGNMKLKIITTIEVDDDLDGETIEGIRDEFEDVAYLYNMVGDPKVVIQEVN